MAGLAAVTLFGLELEDVSFSPLPWLSTLAMTLAPLTKGVAYLHVRRRR